MLGTKAIVLRHIWQSHVVNCAHWRNHAMLHEDHPTIVSRNSRYGLALFAVYVLLYAGFMALAAFWPDLMAQATPLGSVNLAIMYGMGLILAALVLALVYMFLCRAREE
jgi:uncharacterized membrane protein (DUF485 family)